MNQQYFYDDQIRRFLLQFARAFSGFQVEYGRDGDEAALLRVPVRYGDASRNAQAILQENSANSLPSTPMMSYYISALDYDRSRIQNPTYVDKMSVRQRTYDPETDSYDTTQGNAFTIERIMPVPYKLTITLDIWTSNTTQKLQLLEQILTLFNPSLEIQSTDNYIDWTSLSVIELESTTWTSRSIPVGTDNPIDIATLRFSLPIWISPPAKVKKLGVVERVVAGIFDGAGDMREAITNNDLLLGTRVMITPWNYKLVVIENRIQCVYAPTVVPNGSLNSLTPTQVVPNSPLLWPTLLDAYGKYRPGISQIRLFSDQADEAPVVGTFVIDPNNDALIIFSPDPDTVPQNTLAPIDAIIDPQVSSPGNGLPAAVPGQRYLLTESTGFSGNFANPQAWIGEQGQPLVAQANDIIEFNGTRWRVVFASQDENNPETDRQWVTNITTSTQYEWTGQQWMKSYQGVYHGGLWSLVL